MLEFKHIIHPLAVSTPSYCGVAQPKGFFMRTAFLIDGGFFLKRHQRIAGNRPPRFVAKALHGMCLDHLKRGERDGTGRSELYRIFYYDCPPLTKKAHNPITRKAIDFALTTTAHWRLEFFEELKKLRLVALRLGDLQYGLGRWNLRPDVQKGLLSRTITVDDLVEGDVVYDIRQKGVDMRIGLDIASLAYKKLVRQIVLVSGDSDFVPAAKLARREGIDFILDPMWPRISDDLHEHIDGLRTVLPRPQPLTFPQSARRAIPAPAVKPN